MPAYESIVIGAGIIGASAALHLAAHGPTLLIERFEFLHERGSSHGGSRIFRHAYEDEGHVRLARAADKAWRQIEERTGERLLVRTGGLDILKVGSPIATDIASALTAAGSPFEVLSGQETRNRFPAFQLADDDQAVYQPDAGITPATRAVATLLRATAAMGATLRERETVTGVSAVNGGVEVTTDKDTYSAARVVVAGGPWLGQVLPELGLELRVIKQQVLYLRIKDGAREFAPYRMPVFIDRRVGEIYGMAAFELPHAIKVGDHAAAIPTDPDTRGFDLEQELAERTAATTKALMPNLTGEIVSGITCLYTKTRDERFIIDSHPEHPQIVVAGGGSGHAFKFGPVLGEAAAGLALGTGSPHDISQFTLARFKGAA